jgi:hypothetical protein
MVFGVRNWTNYEITVTNCSYSESDYLILTASQKTRVHFTWFRNFNLYTTCSVLSVLRDTEDTFITTHIYSTVQ